MGGAAGRAPGPCPVISPALPCDPAECPEAKEKERKDAPNGVLSATETYVACVEATGEDSSLGLALEENCSTVRVQKGRQKLREARGANSCSHRTTREAGWPR